MREGYWQKNLRGELMPQYAGGSWSQNNSQAQLSSDMTGQLLQTGIGEKAREKKKG